MYSLALSVHDRVGGHLQTRPGDAGVLDVGDGDAAVPHLRETGGMAEKGLELVVGAGAEECCLRGAGADRLPSSSRIHDLEFIAMKGRPSQVNESSWPKRKSSIVG